MSTDKPMDLLQTIHFYCQGIIDTMCIFGISLGLLYGAGCLVYSILFGKGSSTLGPNACIYLLSSVFFMIAINFSSMTPEDIEFWSNLILLGTASKITSIAMNKWAKK